MYIQPAYWQCGRKKDSTGGGVDENSLTIEDMFKLSPENSFEEEPTNLNITVKIQNLFKVNYLMKNSQ